MPSQHKNAPFRIRLPEAERLRLMERLARDEVPANRFITEAVREKLDREEQEMAVWVAYDAVTFDVEADGNEGAVKQYAEGNLTLIAATEADWRRAVKAQDPARMMSGNPPKRHSSSTIHL